MQNWKDSVQFKPVAVWADFLRKFCTENRSCLCYGLPKLLLNLLDKYHRFEFALVDGVWKTATGCSVYLHWFLYVPVPTVVDVCVKIHTLSCQLSWKNMFLLEGKLHLHIMLYLEVSLIKAIVVALISFF